MMLLFLSWYWTEGLLSSSYCDWGLLRTRGTPRSWGFDARSIASRAKKELEGLQGTCTHNRAGRQLFICERRLFQFITKEVHIHVWGDVKSRWVLLSTVAFAAICSEIIASTLLHSDAPVYQQDGLIFNLQSVAKALLHHAPMYICHSNTKDARALCRRAAAGQYLRACSVVAKFKTCQTLCISVRACLPCRWGPKWSSFAHAKTSHVRPDSSWNYDR